MMNVKEPNSDWRLVHGIALVLFLVCSLLVPPLRRWPWLWITPFVGYFLLVACVPPLRDSLSWLQFGRLSPNTIVVTVAVTAVTILGLVVFQSATQPDTRVYIGTLPLQSFCGAIATGTVFSIVNGTLEEFVFRGVLFDAIESQWNPSVTVVGTAVLFGLGHLHGYPPGLLGACLAVLFGLAVGWLRLWTGGLALPIVVHMAADATIFSILVRSGGQ